MDVGIVYPIVGVVVAVIVVYVLRRIMHHRPAKAPPQSAEPALSESDSEFLDSSHIGGPIVGGAADPRWKAGGRSAPPPKQ
jgi:hypothetical protein